MVECYHKGGSSVKGKYPTMEEAKAAADKVAFNYRHKGRAGSINGLGGIGATIPVFGEVDQTLIAAGVLMYIGADLPLARPILKQMPRPLTSRKAVQNTMLLVGLV